MTTIHTANAKLETVIAVQINGRTEYLTPLAARQLYGDLSIALDAKSGPIHAINQCAVAQFNVENVGILSTKCRLRNVSYARWAAWHVMRNRLGLSYHECGLQFGMDHGSVVQGVKRLAHLMAYRPEIRSAVEAVARACE